MAKSPVFGLALAGAMLIGGLAQSGMPAAGAEAHEVQLTRFSSDGSDGDGAEDSGAPPPWVFGGGAGRAKETSSSSGREYEEAGGSGGGSADAEAGSLAQQLLAAASRFTTRADEARESLSDWGKLIYDDLMAKARMANQAGGAPSGGAVSSSMDSMPSAPAPEMPDAGGHQAEAAPAQVSPDVPTPASEPIEPGVDYGPPSTGDRGAAGGKGNK